MEEKKRSARARPVEREMLSSEGVGGGGGTGGRPEGGGAGGGGGGGRPPLSIVIDRPITLRDAR